MNIQTGKIYAEKPSGIWGNISKTIKRNMYQWHKIIGLITIIPVIFWTLSGLMHPFMSHWFKPKIAREFIIPQPLAKEQVQLSVQEILQKNGIEEFKNFRLVHFNDNTFYQIKNKEGVLQYFNSVDAKELVNGDKIYAEFLARYYLADSINSIKNITLQSEFDQQYKYINRLLPVWKVSFDRPDQIDIYVETSSSRLGTFNTTSRKAFLWVFDNFHNWSFLETITSTPLRISIMILFLGIILVSTLSGLVIYGFMWKKFKKPHPENKKGILRQYHRQIGLATAFVTFTFALSGAYHATRKYEPNHLPQMVYEPILKTSDLQTASLQLNLDWERLYNMSVIKKGKKHYFQAFYGKTEEQQTEVAYFDVSNGQIRENGNVLYAQYLANKFANILEQEEISAAACCEPGTENTNESLVNASLLKAEIVSKFESREYGFVFKRLPVVRLTYDTPDKSTFYIETATSRLAAKIDNADRLEGYSFALFHKYLLMDWAGKNIRDFTMMLAALGVLVVSLFGLAVFLKK